MTGFVKVRLCLFVVCLFVASGFAQKAPVQYGYNFASGELVDFTSHTLALNSAVLNAISPNGQYPIEAGALGYVNFTTPRFATGSVATGGTFNAGGTFFVSNVIAFEPGVQFNGTFVNGCWQRDFLSDGSSQYVLTAHVKGSLTFPDGTLHDALGVVVEFSLNQGKEPFIGPQFAGDGAAVFTAIN